MADKYYCITALTKDTKKIKDFTEKCEEYSTNIVTGINYVELNDNTHMLCIYITDINVHKDLMEVAKKYNFDKLTDKEENFTSLMAMSKLMFIGDFKSQYIR